MSRRSFRFTALATIAGLLAFAGPTLAGVPSPLNSTVPTHVNIVGYSAAGLDSAAGRVTVTFRDVANNPVAGVHIGWDFFLCADLRIASDPRDPRLTVKCNAGTVSAVTDAFGVASFTFLGGGRLPITPHDTELARVFEYDDYCVMELRTGITVGIFDLNGMGGVEGLDLGLWGADYFRGSNPDRADYNGDGVVTGLDLSIWGAVFFAGGSRSSPATYCP